MNYKIGDKVIRNIDSVEMEIVHISKNLEFPHLMDYVAIWNNNNPLHPNIQCGVFFEPEFILNNLNG